MAKRTVNGFDVEVTVQDALPRVRVSAPWSEKAIFDSDALSITGLEQIADVFKAASRMAYQELDAYYYRQQIRMREERRS